MQFSTTIYYEDTDAGGVTYHANYLKFAERARTEFLRAKGFNQSKLLKNNLAFVVAKIDLQIVKPSFLDDSLTIHTSLVKVGRACIYFNQQITKQNNLIAQVNSTIACCTINPLKATRLPDYLLQSLNND